jgi:hypothetical protein
MTNKTKGKHLAKLKSFANLWEQIVFGIEQIETPELKYLLKCCSTPTQTNCGWSTYQVTKVITPIIKEEIERRKYASKKAQKLKTTQP